MRPFSGPAILLLLAGCKVAASAGDHVWTVKAPPKVEIGSKLRFTVETHDLGGAPVREVPFIWKVEWAGLEGVRHQGWSFREESIRVKGDPGTGVVRIFASVDGDEMAEVGRASFQVLAAPPPAD